MNVFKKLACLVLVSLNCFPVAAAERPNVVLIVTDNQSEKLLGAYGNSDIKTPNIDALATTGMVEDTIPIFCNELGDMLGGYSVPSEEMIEVARVGVGS